MAASAVGIEGFIVSSVGFRVLRQAFQASGSLFSVFGQKNTKTGLEKTYLLLVTGRSGRYFSWRHVYLNLISYITILIIVDMI